LAEEPRFYEIPEHYGSYLPLKRKKRPIVGKFLLVSDPVKGKRYMPVTTAKKEIVGRFKTQTGLKVSNSTPQENPEIEKLWEKYDLSKHPDEDAKKRITSEHYREVQRLNVTWHQHINKKIVVNFLGEPNTTSSCVEAPCRNPRLG